MHNAHTDKISGSAYADPGLGAVHTYTNRNCMNLEIVKLFNLHLKIFKHTTLWVIGTYIVYSFIVKSM